MRRPGLFALFLAAAALAGARQSDPDELSPSSAEVRRQVVAVIEGQLLAFRTHRLDRAYLFAAPALRLQVPEPEFMKIVRQDYPEIWRSRGDACGVVRDNGSRATVTVDVRGAGGGARYDYILLRQDDGRWLIGGVLRHVPSPGESM